MSGYRTAKPPLYDLYLDALERRVIRTPRGCGPDEGSSGVVSFGVRPTAGCGDRAHVDADRRREPRVTQIRWRVLAKGLATYVPGLYRPERGRTGGTSDARYCYSIWLRHLVMLRDQGLETNPSVVAELGPGDSLGIGLAALLSGASSYVALDVVRYAQNVRNLQVLEELVHLFERREPIPGPDELPEVKPFLEQYAFPHEVLDDTCLQRSLAPD